MKIILQGALDARGRVLLPLLYATVSGITTLLEM